MEQAVWSMEVGPVSGDMAVGMVDSVQAGGWDVGGMAGGCWSWPSGCEVQGMCCL